MDPNARITPENVATSAQAPVTPAPANVVSGPAQAPFQQPVQQQAPAAPVAPVQQPQAPIAPPAQPVAPVQPQAPVEQTVAAPAEAPVVMSQQTQVVAPQAPVAPPAQQQAPTQPAFAYMPKNNQPEQVAATTEYYREDPNYRSHYVKAILDKQPKVLTMIPLMPGEKKGTQHPVGINGYFVYITKGLMVPVPQQIANMIKESFHLDSVIGEQFDLSRNENKQRALS